MKENIKILKGILIVTIIMMIITFIPKDVLAADTIYTSNLSVGNNIRFNGSSWYLYMRKGSTLATSTQLGSISNGAEFTIKGKSGNWLTIDITKGSYSSYANPIYLYYGSQASSCFSKVTTTPSTPTVIAVTNIALNKSSISLVKGKTQKITATILPTNAKVKTVTWSSSNTSVATVSGGTITAKGVGTATITAKSNNNKTATCTVNVTAPAAPTVVAVTNVALNKSSVSLQIGKTQKLTATILPTNAKTKTVTWTSSNTAVATVSGGTITAKGVGSATITAKSNNNKTATCTVNVTPTIVAVTSIKLNKTTLSLKAAMSETLTATISPTNASNKTVTWSSSNPGVAIVNNGTVRGIAIGTATITAKSNNGKTAKCTVTITLPDLEPVPATSVSLSKTTLSLPVGISTTLAATVYPFNASNKTVTWSSSNNSIATVNNGTVMGVKVGTATITVRTTNNKVATCKVTVTQPVVTKTFEKVAREYKQYLNDKNFVYGGNDWDFATSAPNSTSNTIKQIDCSAYVSWVIYGYGKQNNIDKYKELFRYSKGAAGIKDICDQNSQYFTYIGKLNNIAIKDLKAGDIFIRPGHHAEIFTYYDYNKNSWNYQGFTCGCTEDIRDVTEKNLVCNQSISSYYVYRISK